MLGVGLGCDTTMCHFFYIFRIEFECQRVGFGCHSNMLDLCSYLQFCVVMRVGFGCHSTMLDLCSYLQFCVVMRCRFFCVHWCLIWLRVSLILLFCVNGEVMIEASWRNFVCNEVCVWVFLFTCFTLVFWFDWECLILPFSVSGEVIGASLRCM